MLAVILGIPVAGLPQDAVKEVESYFERAMVYNNLSIFGQSINELNLAIEYAHRHNLKEQAINATITLAETMRMTGDFDKSLELLINLPQSPLYPKLHVRKLGRIAAIYNEWNTPLVKTPKDSVIRYLDSALKIAAAINLQAEQAGLYNELGYTIASTNPYKGLTYLLKSAEMFEYQKDTHNYVGSMTNLLRVYVGLKNAVKANDIINRLLPLVSGKQWYAAETELYKTIASHYHSLNDTVSAQYWLSKADKGTIRSLEAKNSAQVNAFRTLYETKKLKEQVTAMELVTQLKQEALDRQTRRTQELVIYLLVLALMAMGVVALLLRERNLKRRLKTTNINLQVSNEKYQVLMVESNHRIKNNLQMVISMLQYSGRGADKEISEAFHQMSGKIQTISMLHKRLTADVHNEQVTMDVYLGEIIAYYQNMAPAIPQITASIVPVKIKSERIIYFGLILNEMIANTIAHGNSVSGTVKFNVTPLAQGYGFEYTDGSKHALTAAKGTGSALIRQLTQRVGGTDFIFNPSSGQYRFTFYE
ncbi:MAG: sensor histidine kinase [Bacteroidetes bacterium]|nr:MAG: sensor histidine kinase [Bacteroidota bacterium]